MRRLHPSHISHVLSTQSPKNQTPSPTPLALRDSKAPLIKKNCALGIQAVTLLMSLTHLSLPLSLSLIHTRLLLFSLRLFLSSFSSFFFPSAVAIRNDNTFRTGDPFREAAPVPRTVGKEVGGQENQADGLTANAPHPWG